MTELNELKRRLEQEGWLTIVPPSSQDERKFEQLIEAIRPKTSRSTSGTGQTPIRFSSGTSGDDIMHFYINLIDMTSLVTVLARQLIEQKYHQQNKPVPSADQYDGVYLKCYSDCVNEIVNDTSRLRSYWKSIENTTYAGSPQSHKIAEASHVDAAALLQDVLADQNLFPTNSTQSTSQSIVSPLQDLLQEVANEILGSVSSGKGTTLPPKGTLFIQHRIPMKPDTSSPERLVRTPTLTMLFVRLFFSIANGRWHVDGETRVTVAVLDDAVVTRNRDKLEKMLNEAIDKQLDGLS